jgi:DNA polymerase III delta subunit
MEFWRFKNEVLPSLKNLLAEDTVLASQLEGIHPYPLYLSLKQVSKFSAEKLMHCLIELAGVDFALKSSTKSPLIMLEMALLPLCNG